MKILKDNAKNLVITKETKSLVKLPKTNLRQRPEKNKSAIPHSEMAKVIAKMPNITIVKGSKNTGMRSAPVSKKHMHYINLEAFLEYSTATPIRSHDGFAYFCCFCNEHYVDTADLKTHTATTHNNSHDIREFIKKYRLDVLQIKLDITQLKCKICDKSIDTVEALFDHLQNEHKKLVYTDVMNRIIPFKFDGKELQCAICHLAFSKYKILFEHMHTHFKNYVCEICNCGFISQRAMYRHKESHKTGTYECSECGKVFENPASRRTHMNTVHKHKNFPSKCGVCNERFKSGPAKDQHMIDMHGMTPIIRKCLACDKTFSSQKSLWQHTKKDHLLERNHQCTECEMKFYSKTQLQKHMVKHSGRKDFQCEICSKWFTRKSVLTEHMRIHANDRRFTCLLCGRGFVQKCSWRGHMRSIHGEIGDKVLPA